jgi:hypothetical protein
VQQLQVIGGYTARITFNKGITLLAGGQLADGVIDQPGGAASDITVNAGTFLWWGGVLNSTPALSTIHFGMDATFDIQLWTDLTSGDKVDNAGDMTLTDGPSDSGNVGFTNGAGITNSGTIDLNSIGSLSFGATGGITNSGTFLIDRGNLKTTGSGEFTNTGTLEVTAAVLVTSQLPIANTNLAAVLYVPEGELDVTGTSATYGCSIYQASGSIKLGLNDPVGGDAFGAMDVSAGFIMNGGSLMTYGSQTSRIAGNVTILNGDIYVRVDSVTEAGTIGLGGAATDSLVMTGGVFHCAVDGTSTAADEILCAGSAFIGGAAQIQVIVMNEPITVDAGTTYTILTAAGGVNALSNFSSSDITWIAPTLNDGTNLELVYAP